MRLETEDGLSLELRILGYQFPDMRTNSQDSNWLIIEGEVAHPRGAWTFRDPCLLAYEVSRLADWLGSLARGTPTSGEKSFMEPNISFRSVESPTGPNVRVYFELEARPPWAPSDVVDEEQCWIDFPVSELELHRAALSLLDQLKKYPQRAAQ
ncbi:MAG: hypothetical protein U0V87_10875 [Acidobacteriota bacterium]